jgi:hypothetical protein
MREKMRERHVVSSLTVHNIVPDGIVQGNVSASGEDPKERGGDWLGHGRNAHHGLIAGHRPLLLHVCKAVPGYRDDLIVCYNRDDSPRHGVRVEQSRHPPVQSLLNEIGIQARPLLH